MTKHPQTDLRCIVCDYPIPAHRVPAVCSECGTTTDPNWLSRFFLAKLRGQWWWVLASLTLPIASFLLLLLILSRATDVPCGTIAVLIGAVALALAVSLPMLPKFAGGARMCTLLSFSICLLLALALAAASWLAIYESKDNFYPHSWFMLALPILVPIVAIFSLGCLTCEWIVATVIKRSIVPHPSTAGRTGKR